MFSSVRHIFFDLDDTLWDLKKNAREGLLKSIALCNLQQYINDTEKFVCDYVRFNKQAWEEYYRNGMDMKQLRTLRFEWLLSFWGISDPERVRQLAETYMEITPSLPHLVEGAPELLDYLYQKGYNLHILTNGFPDVQPRKLRSSNIEKYFSSMIISDEVGYRKPDPEIFRIAAQRVSGSAKECVMIGDQYLTDICGALDAGWHAVWLNRQGNRRYTHEPQIRTLHEALSFF